MAVLLGSMSVILEADTGQYGTQMQSAASTTTRAMGQIQRSVGLTERSIQNLQRTSSQPIRFGNLVAASRGFEGLNERTNVLRGSLLALTAVFGGFAAALGTNVILRYADTFTQLRNQLRVVSLGAGELQNNLLAIRGAADQSRSGILATSTLFSRISKAAPNTDQRQVLEYVTTIQKALALGGATAQEAASAALQFSQAIASNRLGGDEFRAILETPLGLELAKGLGVSIGKLRELSVAGKLTADTVLGSLAKIKPGIDAAFAKSTQTLDQSLILLDNALISAIGHLNDTYGATRLLSGGINFLSRNAEELVPTIAAIGGLLGAVFAGRLLGAGLFGRNAAGEATGLFSRITEGAKAGKLRVDDLALAISRLSQEEAKAAEEAARLRSAATGSNLSAFAPQSAQSGVLRAKEAELNVDKQQALLQRQITEARKASRDVTVKDVSDNAKVVASKKIESALDLDRRTRQIALEKTRAQLDSVTAVLPAGAAQANEKLIAAETRLEELENNRIRLARQLSSAQQQVAQSALVSAASGGRVNEQRAAATTLRAAVAEQARNEAQITAVMQAAATQREKIGAFVAASEIQALQQQSTLRRSIVQQELALNGVYTRQTVQESQTRALAQRAEGAEIAKATALRNKNYGDALKAGLQVAALEAQRGGLAQNVAAAEAEAHAAGQRALGKSLTETAERQRFLTDAIGATTVQMTAARRGATVAGQGLSLLKAGAAGVVGILGGPFGAALVAGIIGLEVYAAKAAAAAQRIEGFRDAAKRAATQRGESTTPLTKDAQQQIVENNKKTLDDRLKDLKEFNDQLAALTTQSPTSKLGAKNIALTQPVDELAKLTEVFRRGLLPQSQYTEQLDVLGQKFPQLKTRISGIKNTLELHIGALQLVKEANDALIESQTKLGATDVNAAIAKTTQLRKDQAAVIKTAVDAENPADITRIAQLRIQGLDAQANALQNLRKIQAEAAKAGLAVPDETALQKLLPTEELKNASKEITALFEKLSGGKLLNADAFGQSLDKLLIPLQRGGVSLQTFLQQAQSINLANGIEQLALLTRQLVAGTKNFADYKFELATIGAAQPDLLPFIKTLSQSSDTAKAFSADLTLLAQKVKALDGSSATIFLKVATGSVETIAKNFAAAFENVRKQGEALASVNKELDEANAKSRALATGGQALADIETRLQKIREDANRPLLPDIEKELRGKIAGLNSIDQATNLFGQLGSVLNSDALNKAIDSLAGHLAEGNISVRAFAQQAAALNINNGIQQIDALTKKLVAGKIGFDDYKFALAAIGADFPSLLPLIHSLQQSEAGAKLAAAAIRAMAAEAARVDKTTVTVFFKIVTAGVEGSVAGITRAFIGATENFKKQAETLGEVQKQFDEAQARKRGFESGGEIGAKVEGEIQRRRDAQGVPFAAGAEETLRRQLTTIETINKEISDGKKAVNAENKEWERTQNILDKIQREGEGAFLGDIDRQVIEKTKNIQNAAVLVRQYIDALNSGDLSKAPKELLQVREALLQVGSADLYRNIIQEMGTGAQLTQTFADKQEQLLFLLNNGKISVGQYQESWANFVTGFRDYKWIDDVTQAFGEFGKSAILDFKNIGTAVDSLKNHLLDIIVQTLIITPLMQQLKNLMVGLFGPTGASFFGGGTNVAGGAGANAVTGGAAGATSLAAQTVLSSHNRDRLSTDTSTPNVAGLGNILKGASPDNLSMAAYIRESAAKYNIDPDVAVRVARSEGLAPGVWQSNVVQNGIREPSYGPFQLLKGGQGTGFPEGLGNRFQEQTGLDPANPANARAGVDFALKNASQTGWGQWYGAKASGIGNWQGIGNRQGETQQIAAQQQLTTAAKDASSATTGLADNLTKQATPAITGLATTTATVAQPAAAAAQGTTQFANSLGQPGGGGGLLGIFKSLFGGGEANIAPTFGTGGLYHSGLDGGGTSRSVMWTGMEPRLHSGLAANEFKAILQHGETTLTQQQTARTGSVIAGLSATAANNNGGGGVKVVVNNRPGQDAEIQHRNGPDGEEIVIGITKKGMARGDFDSVQKGRYAQQPSKVI